MTSGDAKLNGLIGYSITCMDVIEHAALLYEMPVEDNLIDLSVAAILLPITAYLVNA